MSIKELIIALVTKKYSKQFENRYDDFFDGIAIYDIDNIVRDEVKRIAEGSLTRAQETAETTQKAMREFNEKYVENMLETIKEVAAEAIDGDELAQYVYDAPTVRSKGDAYEITDLGNFVAQVVEAKIDQDRLKLADSAFIDQIVKALNKKQLGGK